MLTWPALTARLNGVAFARVANKTVTIAAQQVDVVWNEPYDEDLGVSSSNPSMTLPTSVAQGLGITKDTEDVAVTKDSIAYLTSTHEPDSEGMTVCVLRRG